MIRLLALAFALSGIALASNEPVETETATETESSVGLRLLPNGRPFQLTFPDPREIRMGISFEGDSKLIAQIGNYFSLLAIEPTELSEGEGPAWKMHFGLEGAGYFSMRSADGRFPLETTDGLVGAYLEGRAGMYQWQMRFTHISSHLSDGSSGSPIAYSREILSLRAGLNPDPRLNLYTGFSYLAHTVPNLRPWGFQIGGSYFLPWGVASANPFIGFDLKWKEESDVNPSLALQLGVGINNPPEAYRSFRFFYSYYTGADPRGQFLNRLITSHSFGIEMQI